MATLTHQHPAAERPRPPCSRAAVRWLVSRAALHAARPDLADAEGGPVTLEIALDARGVQARIVDGGGARPIEVAASGAPAWTADRGSALIHLEIPSILTASIAPAAEGRPAAALYARTGLFGTWGLAGGRYEVCSAEVG